MARFSYNGGGANPTLPGSYTLGSTACTGNQKLCSIEADNVGGEPDISNDLIAQMLVAVVTNTPTATVALKN